MKEIAIEVKLEFKEYAKLIYYLFYRRPIIVLITVFGFMLLILSVSYFIGFFEHFDQPPIVQLILGICFVFVVPLAIYRQAKKSFSTFWRLRENMKYVFTNEKVCINGESFTSEMTWDKISKIVETKSWILLYQKKVVTNIITKRSFNQSQFIAFKELAGTIKNLKVKLKK